MVTWMRLNIIIISAITLTSLFLVLIISSQAVSAVTIHVSTPDQVLIITDNDSSNNLVSRLKNEGPGSETNYSIIEINESLNLQQVILGSDLEQYNSILIILSDFEDVGDEYFSSEMIAKLDDRIAKGVSIGVISSGIWETEDEFKEFLGIQTPTQDSDAVYSHEDEEVITFTVTNDSCLKKPYNFTNGQEINVIGDIGIITGIDTDTEVVLSSENLGELPEIQLSGIYLKSQAPNKGKILTIPLSLEETEDETIIEVITSISYHVITWSTQKVLLHLPQDSRNSNVLPLADDLSYLFTPRSLITATVATGGVVAVGAGGVAAFKGVSRVRAKNKEDEEEWPLGTGWLLFILGPIIGIIAQIIYSPNIRKITHSDVHDHPTRRQIMDILDYKDFEHFNSLRKQLGISVSSLTWHMQVLEDFSLIRTSTFGQYKVFYLVGRRPKKEEVVLCCTVRSKKAFKIVESFLKAPEWTVDNLSQLLDLSKAMVKYHAFKLVSIDVLTFSEKTNSFKLVQEKRDLLVWLIDRESVE